MVSNLAPTFLAAVPGLGDPTFKKSLVLLVEHKPEGSLGFIINRNSSLRFPQLAKELDLAEHGHPTPEMPVMLGGPVSPQTGWVVFDPRHSLAAATRGTIRVNDNIHLSTSKHLLRRIARQEEVGRHLLLLGYAGWGAGQLDQEIQEGSWLPLDVAPSIVFETPLEKRWETALARSGISPWQIVRPNAFA